MSEEPQSIWKNSWRGTRALFIFCQLVVAPVTFVAVLAIGSLSEKRGMDFAFTALICGVGVALAAFLAVQSIRWLCCWRNLIRFLFGVACLMTLIALFVTEENWRGKRAWAKFKAEWEAKGERFDLTSFVPPPVPDGQNFAMTPLLKPIYEYAYGSNGVQWLDTNAFNHLHSIRVDFSVYHQAGHELPLGNLEKGTLVDLETCRNFYRGNTNYPQPVKSGTAAEDILVALSKFDAEMKELGEAATARPYSRFPVQYDYEPSFAILLPHLASVKPLSTICQLRAIARLEAGQTAEAFADLKLGFRLSDSIRAEPILIDHLVRIVMLDMDLQVVREGLVRHAWNNDQLTELEKYLASVDLLAELNQAIRGERALSVGSLDWIRRQGFRFNVTELYGGYEGDLASVGVPNFMPSGWFYQNMLTIARLHQNYSLAMVDEKAHRVLPDIRQAEVNSVVNMPARPYTIYAKVLFPALYKASAKSARMQTYVDATRTACALERYRLANGQLPDTLDTLAPRFIAKIPNDVIDGKPLRYRGTADGGYVIYSVGWNKTDDGGIVASPKGGVVEWEKKRGPADLEKVEWEKRRGPVDPEKGDWVWRYPAKE